MELEQLIKMFEDAINASREQNLESVRVMTLCSENIEQISSRLSKIESEMENIKSSTTEMNKSTLNSCSSLIKTEVDNELKGVNENIVELKKDIELITKKIETTAEELNVGSKNFLEKNLKDSVERLSEKFATVGYVDSKVDILCRR